MNMLTRPSAQMLIGIRLSGVIIAMITVLFYQVRFGTARGVDAEAIRVRASPLKLFR